MLLPGALIVALAFSAGGFFPGTVALVVLGLGLVLVLRLTQARRPLEGLSAPYAFGAAALALFAIWTLVSSHWSDAPARALLEYDRVLLYLLAFVVVGCIGYTPARLRWMTRAIALGAVAVCVCALITRVAPDVWPIALDVSNEQLNYPLTYSNGLGLLAAVGLVLCFALTSDGRERPLGRVLAAAAVPALATTQLLTFSRGAIVAVVVGIVAVVVVGRPRALLSGVLATLPVTAIAVMHAYDAELLAEPDPTTAAATAQGHDLALVVALCVLGAVVARALLLALDARLARIHLPGALRRPAVAWSAAGTLVVAAVAGALVAGAWDGAQRQYDHFVESPYVSSQGGVRLRLTNSGNNGRLEEWGIALDGFREDRWRGNGAGTYALMWDRGRERDDQIEDGHSLYIEVLGELGLVGLVLVGAAIVLVLFGFLKRARGPDRVVGAALFGAGLAWALHASTDWDWELPAITLWFFASGGLALASARRSDDPVQPDERRAMNNPLRVAAAAGCLVLLIVPFKIYSSQGPLNDAARAFAKRDCPATVDHALDSVAALGVRHEPWVLLGYCDVRLGQARLGVSAMSEAVRRDPGNWETHYGLALVRGAAGLDPRPEARIAHRLNPGEPMTWEALRRFDTNDRRLWQRRAAGATLPTQ